jgi:hypothetical protein
MMGNLSEKVFISHASKDKIFVDRLVSDLAARGVPVRYDRLDVRLGDSIPGKINGGISEAKYLLVVLSPAAVKSKWVREELNAALMRQVASAGTFLLPVLVEDCDVPPLLGHRRFADFRESPEAGLEELLGVFGRDTRAAGLAGKNLVHPGPDPEVSDREFIYLHSQRFDKFFRMNCELEWTADHPPLPQTTDRMESDILGHRCFAGFNVMSLTGAKYLMLKWPCSKMFHQ